MNPDGPEANGGGGLPVGFRGVVRYKDGRTEEFDGGQALVAAWELYALRHGYPTAADKVPGNLMALYVAFEAIEGGEGFDTWRKGVYGLLSFENVVVPPTPAVASAG